MSGGGRARVAGRAAALPDPGEVEELRAAVEEVDDALVGLLARRLELARALGEKKHAAGLPTLDPAREAEVVGRAGAVARELGLPVEAVRSIFWTVVETCRAAQRPDG